jgi:hypothetical protein
MFVPYRCATPLWNCDYNQRDQIAAHSFASAHNQDRGVLLHQDVAYRLLVLPNPRKDYRLQTLDGLW